MENETEQIVWHKFKDTHVATKGDQAICVVEPTSDLPFHGFSMQPLSSVYTTLEAAKKEAEEGHGRYLKHKADAEKPQPNFYLEILKQVVAAIEKQEAAK